jgi:glycosyltransferase involved in cell wall biosynthesis
VTTVALEYRPALFQAFGIGRYVKNLAPALLAADPDLELVLFSVFLRGHAARERGHPWPAARARRVGVRFPGRVVPLLGRLGYSFDERLAPFDLFHHTDYAITPLRTRRRVVTLYDTAWLPRRGFVEPVQSRRMESAVRALLRGDPEVLTLSDFARGELVEAFSLAPERVHVTPLAADPVFAIPRGAAAIDEAQRRHGLRAPYVIALGTLEPRKNVVRLVRAVAEARRAAPDLGLVLLGRKGYRHEEVFAEAAPLGSAVRWLGSVPDADAASLVQGAAALAFPSLYEGFGLPAIEGMAAGVPVIASDIPVMREICGAAAILVDTTRDGVLAEAIRWALNGRGPAALAAAGRERAAQFTWDRCAAGTLRAYERVLERTR